MATFRIAITAGAALGAVLTLTIAPAIVALALVGSALAETQATMAAPGAPLKLTPSPRRAKTFARHTRTFKRTARARMPRHTAQRREASVARPQEGTVMGGQNSIGLIAKLPWWRADEAQGDRQREKEAESQVLSATEAWLGLPLAETEAASDYAQGSADELNGDDPTAETFTVADANEINEIDLAAAETAAPSDNSPSDRSWIHALLAVLGGAFAAAASARFLLV
jgi:hypothetical protein